MTDGARRASPVSVPVADDPDNASSTEVRRHARSCASHATNDTVCTPPQGGATTPFSASAASSPSNSFNQKTSCPRVSPKTAMMRRDGLPASSLQGVKKSPSSHGARRDTTRLTPLLGRLLSDEQEAIGWCAGVRAGEGAVSDAAAWTSPSAVEKPIFNRRSSRTSTDPLTATGLMQATVASGKSSPDPASSASGATSHRPNGSSSVGEATSAAREVAARLARSRLPPWLGADEPRPPPNPAKASGVQTAIDVLTGDGGGPTKAGKASLRPGFAPTPPPRPAGARCAANACPPTAGRLARHDAQTRQLPMVPAFGA